MQILMKHDTKALSRWYDIAGVGAGVMTDLLRKIVRVEHKYLSFARNKVFPSIWKDYFSVKCRQWCLLGYI